MSEAVAIQVIATLGLVAVAMIGVAAPVLVVVARRLVDRVKAIQEQVANDHKNPDGTPLNLRDDLDEKHDENKGTLQTLLRSQLKTQADIAWLMRRQSETDDRLDGFEDTLNPKRESHDELHQ